MKNSEQLIEEMALEKARQIIDKFNEFDVFSEACEMAEYMVDEILEIGQIKFGHPLGIDSPTFRFWCAVKENIKTISNSLGKDW